MDFLEKGLEIVSLLHFVYDFSGKMFLLLYSVKDTQRKNTLKLNSRAYKNLNIDIWVVGRSN